MRALTSCIRDKALAAEEARTVARETVDALLATGISRIWCRQIWEATGSASILGLKWCARSQRLMRHTPGAPV